MDAKEIEFFKKSMINNITKAMNGSIVLTDFLDENQQAILNSLSQYEVQIVYDGGFVHSEYQRAMIAPSENDFDEFKIVVFEIIYPKRYLELNHRKILGSLMNLGVMRKSIGDIYIHDGKAYFACTKEIAPFLSKSFNQISGVPIELKIVDETIEIIRKWEYRLVVLSSTRLDVVIAGAYHFSRKEALEIITAGDVSVHHQVCLNHSYLVKVNDVISVRHKGRIYINEIGGKTKNDRIHMRLGFLVS